MYRVRASIDSSFIGVNPTKLKLIKIKCINGLRNLKNKHGSLHIDEIALEIVVQDGITLQPPRAPIFILTSLLGNCRGVNRIKTIQLFTNAFIWDGDPVRYACFLYLGSSHKVYRIGEDFKIFQIYLSPQLIYSNIFCTSTQNFKYISYPNPSRLVPLEKSKKNRFPL